MLIKPKSALETELAEITKICKENSEPVYLTNHGEGELVIMSLDAYKKREEMLDLRAKLMEAEIQYASGAKLYTTAEVGEYIKELHSARI